MKVLLAAAGYPPDVCGGTERSVQSLARGLLRAGHDVVVVAGTDRFEDGFRISEDSDADPVSGRTLRVHRIHRDDLFYEHWQKSLAPRVGRAFDDILRAERPDVVHVHHWVRLTRDLVHRATVLGFPTVLSLHDYAPSCLIVHRIRPSDLSFCRSKLGTDPCLSCAQPQRPGTPFVSEAEQSELLDSFRRVATRELRSAGQVLVLSRDQGVALEELVGSDLRDVDLRALGVGVDLEVDDRASQPLPLPGTGGQRLVLGTWGTLHRLKGVDLILEAMRRLEDHLRPELHVAGVEVDSQFKAEVDEHARGLAVSFHGAFALGELAEHAVTRVHAAVHATRARETWGITVDEALVLRIPMVLPRIGAFVERIPERAGVVYYTSGDVAALANVLRNLQEDADLLPELRKSLPEARDVVQPVDEFVRRVVGVYEDVIASGVRSVRDMEDPPGFESTHERRMAEWDRMCEAHLGLERSS
jgi:glycosyltransferase involved in cell wall biosynthesis